MDADNFFTSYSAELLQNHRRQLIIEHAVKCKKIRWKVTGEMRRSGTNIIIKEPQVPMKAE